MEDLTTLDLLIIVINESYLQFEAKKHIHQTAGPMRKTIYIMVSHNFFRK